ncbi:Tn7-like element transposition protein TnsE [Shewanella putrefaciens]|uniref:TnsE C-terminal domain-containing protein n=1 Tax=Shewanella putrefaciens (strain CN-32 / ATCC BAA-453) TaxID=319224 RepID=A4YCG5_SHEPC|nr:Tn7-like element transposition protein TnsE [Shewanella putrefaciens]QGS48025.1 transposase [Shewanella putrefaciens]
MQKKTIKKIPVNAKLAALGNQFRKERPDDFWRFASFFTLENGQEHKENFDVEALCVMALGRTFTQDKDALYKSGGFRRTLSLPPIESWQDAKLGDCPRLAKRWLSYSEIANQRCFVFTASGMTVWLPKFELARKLFFHAGFIIRAAYQPNGLDMMFHLTEGEPGEGFHIFCPAGSGIPVAYLRIPAYRQFLSWLLLNKEIKASFESIWQCLNTEQTITNGYCRWIFNFIPPKALSGLEIQAQGAFDSEHNDLLVWEVSTLKELPHNMLKAVKFSHPDLRQSVGSGKAHQGNGNNSAAEQLEIDTEREPSQQKERALIELSTDGLSYSDLIITQIEYNRKKPISKPKPGDESASGAEKVVLGTKDDVIDGDGRGGDFAVLEDTQDETEKFKDRFTVLVELIWQLADDPELQLQSLVIKPLPAVKRCHLHLKADGSERCYLLAKFVYKGRIRYLLEVDTSDNKRRLTTRIFSISLGVREAELITRILTSLIKNSLRWPISAFKTHAISLSLIRHALSNDHIASWRLRILAGIKIPRQKQKT